jgi:LysM repeat protein
MLLGIDGGSIKPAVSHHSPSVHLSRPHPAASHPAASGSSGSYSVHSGDTLSGIASSQGLSLASLEKDNPQIKNPNFILPGEQIHLLGGSSSGQQQPQSGGNHIIRPTVNRPVNPGLGPVGGPARGQFIPSASSNSQPVYNLIGYFVARPTSDAQFV